jgi:hypothetical protein
MKNLIQDDRAQAAGIIMFVASIFITGFLYILLGGIVQSYVDANNMAIVKFSYSQDHRDMMDGLFRSWWVIPLYFLVVAIIYAIKNGIQEQTVEAY